MNHVSPGAHARLSEWLARNLAGALTHWLPSQRWFGGKSRQLDAAAVEEIIWLDAGEEPAAMVIARVAYADAPGDEHYYALVVGLADGGTVPSTTPIASPIDGGGTAVVECGAEPGTVQALLRAMVEGVPLAGERGGTLVPGDQTAALGGVMRAPARPQVRPIGNEQSNTSVRIGGAHVFKLIRRLHDGEHPQLEIGRFLRRAGFTAAPPLEGSFTYHAADGRRFAVGVVEGWVENTGDGWSHVVRRLESGARAGDGVGALSDDFARLGTITADFHLAMASDTHDASFAPIPVTPDHRVAWRNQVIDQARRAVALVERTVSRWPEPLGSRGRALIAARARIERRVMDLDAQAEDNDFRIIRIHGDFHLGQTLKTSDGFTLIDFEGEPLKSIAERRARQSALKDVAGMLRSIDYAAAHVHARMPEAPYASLFTTPLRRAFAESYVAESRRHGASYLPAAWAAVEALCSLFELEKALYELDYEVNNRPDWIHIPLEAVTRLGAHR